ncbi:MAG TPA: FAD-dependent oxidoreductase [Chryseosolibacter sp.]|nr:FAD-dependent oxidoreductase [Chryseosolibacter sp.]
MKHFSHDYIIVGQGLAGSCVAVQLLRKKRSFVVIDQPDDNRCTVVAAGMFNPVTGQNLIKTWMADFLFPYLHDFYPQAEGETGQKFFYSLPLYRPFASVHEQNEWVARSTDPVYQPIIEDISTRPGFPGVRDPFGGLTLKQCGYIRTTIFVHALRAKLVAQNCYKAETFDPSRLKLLEGGVSYGQIMARRVIFCEGAGVVSNPWFGKLPVRPLKGETISIKSEYDRQVIVNRGVYMVPAGETGTWRVGSTYNFKDRVPGNTAAGREELLEKLADLIDFDFEIFGEDWGFRPTVVDRKPILGNHPQYRQLVIFNGLGTKGVSLAPYFSDVLLQWLETETPLHKDVDVSRFKSYIEFPAN